MKNTNAGETRSDPKDISLQDFVLIIWRSKWAVAVITGISLLIGFVYTFFIADSLYSNHMIIYTKPIETLKITQDTYCEQFRNNSLLQETIRDTSLQINPADLSAMINTAKSGTDKIEITLAGSSPQFVFDLANNMADNYIEYMKAYINEKYESERLRHDCATQNSLTNLQQKTDALNEFILTKGSAELHKAEIDMLLQQITSYNKDLTNAERDYRVYKSILSNIEINIDIDSEYLSEKVIDAQIGLLKAKSQMEVIAEDIEDMEIELSDRQIAYNSDKYTYSTLVTEYDTAVQNYESNNKALQDFLSIDISSIKANHISIVSSPVMSDMPIGPNKMKNIIVSLTVGLILGIGFVLIRSWIKEKIIPRLR